mgnify:CR=1 FL=1|tara:strand:- start:4136 stop:4576 length:441 start_codon:yes stop_codon:yes gene_type:complete
MKVDAVFNSKEVQKMLKKYPNRIDRATKDGLETASTRGENIIRERTQRGRGVHGAFKRYSEGYLKHLRTTGRPTKPDLIYDNHMMGSLFAKARSSKLAIISFRRTPEKRKAIWNHKTRPFFDHNHREKKMIRKEFAKEFYRNMARA